MERRTSRLPVRAKSMERISSVKRPSTMTKKRSTSIDRSMVTPISFQSRVKPSTSSGLRRNKSPLANKLKQPIDDPEWQKKELQKIIEFVHAIDPTIKNFKKPSVIEFVSITNIILMEISKGFEINKDNYKVQLPKLLTLLEYPSTISKSTLQAPYSSTAFIGILGIWSFLLDLMNRKNTPDQPTENYEPCLMHLQFNCHKRQLHALCRGVVTNEPLEDFQAAVVDFFDMNSSKTANLKKKLENEQEDKMDIEENVNLAKEKLKIAKEKLNKHNVEIEMFRVKADKDRQDVLTKIESIKTQMPLWGEKLKESEKIMDNIQKHDKSYSEEDLKEQEAGNENLTLTIELHTERKNQYLYQIDEVARKYKDIMQEIQRKVYQTNTNLLSAAIYYPEAASSCLPDEGLLKLNYMPVMEDKNNVVNSFIEKITAELVAKKKLVQETSQLMRDLENQLTLIKEKQLDKKQSLQSKEWEMTKEKSKSNLTKESLRQKVETMLEKLKQHQLKEPDSTGRQIMVQQNKDRLAEVGKEKGDVFEKCKKEAHEAYDAAIASSTKLLVAAMQRHKKVKDELQKTQEMRNNLKEEIEEKMKKLEH